MTTHELKPLTGWDRGVLVHRYLRGRLGITLTIASDVYNSAIEFTDGFAYFLLSVTIAVSSAESQWSYMNFSVSYPIAPHNADQDADGEPDECQYFGDLDRSGAVGPFDLAFLLGFWGPNPGHPGDLNGDGAVGPADLALPLGYWGPCE